MKTKKSRIVLYYSLTICVVILGCMNEEKRNTTTLDEIQAPYSLETLEPWKEGYLDIHHINTGRGDASFFIFPDGTTMVYDAGAIQRLKEGPYKLHPNDSLRAGQWMTYYIKKVLPIGVNPVIDYALISHFHIDHYGEISLSSPYSNSGAYQLSGITDVGDAIPIKKMIDRNYPVYNYPVDLSGYYQNNLSFNNYRSFIEYQKINSGMQAEALIPGIASQIVLNHEPEIYPSFKVRNVGVNGIFWTGLEDGTEEFQYDTPLVNEEGKFSENPLSIVLKITYGFFDYYVGGDLPGFSGWPDYDMETPVAKVVGDVDVMVLNHHGYKDANNDFFLKTLSPEVVVHQTTHDPHYQEGVLTRLNKFEQDAFSTSANPSSKEEYGALISSRYKSTSGHILLRVYPEGIKYEVIILDDDSPKMGVKQIFSNYTSK